MKKDLVQSVYMTSDIVSVIIVVLLSSLIGLTIIKVIEVRMSDIAINMPTIKLPTIKLPNQNITVKVEEPDIGVNGTTTGSPISTERKATIIHNSHKPSETEQSGGDSSDFEKSLTISQCNALIKKKQQDDNIEDISPTLNTEIIKSTIMPNDPYLVGYTPRIASDFEAGTKTPDGGWSSRKLDPNTNEMKELAFQQKKLIGDNNVSQLCLTKLPPERSYFEKDKFQSRSMAIKKPIVRLPEPSKDHKSRPAIYIDRKSCITEPEKDPNLTATYYKDPKNMTIPQLIKFQEKAKIENMTIKDYQNWLLTFKEFPQRLIWFHRQNLKILLRGGELDISDMPSRSKIPSNAKDHYSQIMRNNVENIPNPEFLGYQPSNCEDQMGSCPSSNRNIRHLDYINPDEPLKTWELTNERFKV